MRTLSQIQQAQHAQKFPYSQQLPHYQQAPQARKLALRYYAVAALLVGLSGCSSTTSGSDESNLPAGATAVGAGPMNIETTRSGSVVADFEAGSWTLSKPYGSCSATGAYELDTSRSIRSFEVVGDTLYTWRENSCDARTWTGGTANLSGTWTPVGTAPVPDSSWRSVDGCDSASADTEEVSLAFAGGNLTTREVWSEFCWSETTVGWNEDPTVTATASGCNRVEMTQGDKSATLTLEGVKLDTEGEFITFTSGGTTCRLESPSRFPTSESECAEAYEAWQADGSAAAEFDIEEYSARALAQKAYEACVEATGWTGPR